MEPKEPRRIDPYKEFKLPEPKTEIEELQDQLGVAAAHWYRTRDAQFVFSYHEIYRKLRQLGWNGSIDIDTELPEELMPPEYMELLV